MAPAAGSGKKTAESLYDKDGVPVPGMNRLVREWLAGETIVREHKTPAAFDEARSAYDTALAALRRPA